MPTIRILSGYHNEDGNFVAAYADLTEEHTAESLFERVKGICDTDFVATLEDVRKHLSGGHNLLLVDKNGKVTFSKAEIKRVGELVDMTGSFQPADNQRLSYVLSLFGDVWNLVQKFEANGPLKIIWKSKLKKANGLLAREYEGLQKERPDLMQALISIMVSIWRKDLTLEQFIDGRPAGTDQESAKNIYEGVWHYVDALPADWRAAWNKSYAERNVKVKLKDEVKEES